MNVYRDVKSFVDSGFEMLTMAPCSVVDDGFLPVEPLRIDWSWLGLRSLENMSTDELWDFYTYHRRSRLGKTIKAIINARKATAQRRKRGNYRS